jgi:mono/diheme cytochrome c family protein
MSAASNRDPRGPLPTVEQAGTSDADLSKVHAVLQREKPEPVEGYSPIPIFFIFLISAMVFWAGVYLEKFRGNWDPLVYDHRFSGGGSAVVAVALTPDSPEWIRRGQRLYTANCQACHGPAGMGVPGAFPPLAGAEWVVGEDSEKYLPRVLLHGLQGAIRVRGLDYNGNMPAQSAYTNAQIAQVSSFIRSQWGNNARPITEEEVAEVRRLHGQRGPWDGPSLIEAVNASK